jgi:hypothetical protein
VIVGAVLLWLGACSQQAAPSDAGAKSKAKPKASADAGMSRADAGKSPADPRAMDAGADAAAKAPAGCRSDSDCAALGKRCDRSTGDCVDSDAGAGGTSGAGGSGGVSGASGAGGSPSDAGACSPALTSIVPGNLLIIFDQSSSMQEAWQSTTKLEAAKQALIDTISAHKDSLTVGAIFLPYAEANPTSVCIIGAGGSWVQPIDGVGNIPFRPASDFLEAFNAHWSMAGAGTGLGTPLNEAFDRADVALRAARTNASLSGRFAVLVFTDGMPNCSPDPAATGTPTKPEPNRAADWLTQGVATYVIGLPGADGVMYLNDIALNGGSGMALNLTDPGALPTALGDLIERAVLQPGVSGSADPDCGGCSPACVAPTSCINGTCACPAVGRVLCNGTCIWTTSDDMNCGACGNACMGGTTCCASKCVDTKSDKANCGGCGQVCVSTTSTSCSGGACKCGGIAACKSPQTCTVGGSIDGGLFVDAGTGTCG